MRLVALLLADASNVGCVDLVPGGHVLFHAGGDAGLVALGEGGAGLHDALFEAVVLQFLKSAKLMLVSGAMVEGELEDCIRQ